MSETQPTNPSLDRSSIPSSSSPDTTMSENPHITTSSNNDDETQPINDRSSGDTITTHQEPSSSSGDATVQAPPQKKTEPKNDHTCAYIYRYLLPFILLFIYLAFGVVFYIKVKGALKKNATSTPVTFIDALYFSTVTLSTVGYGDIFPNTTVARIVTCVFILLGFVLGCLLNNLFGHICGAIEKRLVRLRDGGRFKPILKSWMFDEKNTEMSRKAKLCVCFIVIIFSIAIGTIIANRTEKLGWIDSFYLSVTSVTTVGYGDYSFKSSAGKWSASIWIFISTIAVASSLSYLISQYDLQRKIGDMKKITLSDLAAAGIDKHGLISEYDFAIHMLKQMGKISETEIQAIDKKYTLMPKDANGNINLQNCEGNV